MLPEYHRCFSSNADFMMVFPARNLNKSPSESMDPSMGSESVWQECILALVGGFSPVEETNSQIGSCSQVRLKIKNV